MPFGEKNYYSKRILSNQKVKVQYRIQVQNLKIVVPNADYNFAKVGTDDACKTTLPKHAF
jgi:hypothetical protein